jgi:hypothetical protein
MPRLVTVEAAEQAQKLRVVGEELAGVREEAAGEWENRGMAGSDGGQNQHRRWGLDPRRPEAGYREEEEGIENVMGWPT